MDAIQALKTRRSIRAYQKSRSIPRDVLADIVDCARLAPAAMNGQTWEFVAVTNPQTLKKLAGLISHSAWVGDCPAAVAVFAKADNTFYVEDGSGATVCMLVAAKAHGLGSCWIGGDKTAYADAVRQLLGAPATYKLVSVVALGYAAEEPVKDKRPIDSVLHWEKY